MSYIWVICFLCSGEGRLELGDNYNKFFNYKDIKCPLCNGKRQLAIKSEKVFGLKKERIYYERRW